MLIWTAGVKGSCLADIIEGIELSKRNCVPVDETLRITVAKNIFAAGDVATTLDPKTKNPVPMTAQKALDEGKYIARYLLILIKDPKTALAPYRAKPSSFIIPIAGKYAVLETPYLKISGIFIWALKYFVILKYLLSIVSVPNAFKIVMREVRLYAKTD